MYATDLRSDATVENILDVARIEKLLIKRGLTSVKARAAFLGMHRATLAAYLNGEMTPSLPATRRIAAQLGVKVDTLLNERWAA
jgi:transcriptional regulator with XRE-family HTH domain